MVFKMKIFNSIYYKELKIQSKLFYLSCLQKNTILFSNFFNLEE